MSTHFGRMTLRGMFQRTLSLLKQTSTVELSDTFPRKTPTFGPLLSYIIEREGGFRGPGEAIIFGPNISKRSLGIPGELVRKWIQENRHTLAIIRSNEDKRKRPTLLVVLEEWICNTWIHLSWESCDCDCGPTKLELVQHMENSAPQWKFMGSNDKTLSVSRMMCNWTVILFAYSLF